MHTNKKSYLGSLFFACLIVAPFAFSGCNKGEITADNEVGNSTTVVAVNQSTDNSSGCCGKCETETVSSSEPLSCGNGCNACAEGNSEKCKCEEQSEIPSTETDESEATNGRELKPGNSVAHDRDVFHFLLTNHESINRTVTKTENGVETLTESNDPDIVAKLQEHVESMSERVENGRPLRRWDTLYQEIFKHADKIEMKLERTDSGIKVTETSDDEYVVKLIQSHAKVVSGFAERGFEEARKNHDPPKKR